MVSLNRRTFSIAITAWLAKVLSSSTAVMNNPRLGAGLRDGADDLTCAPSAGAPRN
jgi:hypothetical protein